MSDYLTIVDGRVDKLAHFLGTPDLDIDFLKPDCKVHWNFEIEARSWGIKSMFPCVTRVVTSIEWSVYTDELTADQIVQLVSSGGKQYEKEICGTIEIDTEKLLNGKEWGFEVEFKADDGMCSPEDAEIDFEDMTIIIS